jgi:inner membrane transporter RhtA
MKSWLSSSNRVLPIGLMMIAMLSVQSGASIAKSLFPAVGAEGATTLRLGISAVIMTIVWRPWRAKIDRTNVWPLIGYGLVLGAMNLMFYLALRTIPLGVAVALEFTGPLTVALLQSRRAIDFLWILLAVGGLLLLLPLGRISAAIDLVGAAFALAAGVCWALYIVFGQKAGALHGGRAVALGTLIAAALVTPFGVAHAGAALLSQKILPIGLAVALLSSAIPYSLEMVGLTRLPTRTFGILMSLEPAIGALSGFLLLGERLATVQLVAIAAVIAASIGAVATTGKTTAPEVPLEAT